MRNANVFIVDDDTFPVVREKLVAGIGINDSAMQMHPQYTHPNSQKPISGKFWRGTLDDFYADIARMREGDLAFFYNQGDEKFYGIYELSGEPYFDSNNISTSNGEMKQNRSLRVSLEPYKNLSEGVAEKRAMFDPTDPGNLWALIARKARGERSVLSVPPDHATKLTRLLYKNNDETGSNSQRPYQPSSPQNIPMPFIVKGKSGVASERLRYEKRLEGWFMENVDNQNNPTLRSAFGPVEELSWFANDIPYNSAGDAMDMLAYHSRKNVEGNEEFYKVTVVELKNTGIGLREVQQVEYYTEWAAKWIAEGDYAMVQPILVGSYIKQSAKEYLRSRKEVQTELSRGLYRRPIRIFLYKIFSDDIDEQDMENQSLHRAVNGELVLRETDESRDFDFEENE